MKKKMKHKNLTAAIRIVSRFVLSGPEFKSRSRVQISVLLERAVEDKVSVHLVISAFRWRAVPFPGRRKELTSENEMYHTPLLVFFKAQKVQKIPVSKLILFLFLVAFLVLVVYDRHEAKKTSEIAFPIYPFFSYLYLH